MSQLQVVFNELKVKGHLSKVKGNGLRRILHAYINTKSVISVCFTISPAKNNAVTTASTLKFAVQAGMVKVKPIKAEKQVNWKQLVEELQLHIKGQDKIIGELNDQIAEFQDQLDDLEGDLDAARKEISTLMLEAAKGPEDKQDAKSKEMHDRAQASVHKLGPSIASIASLKGFLARKESTMSLTLRTSLINYRRELMTPGASVHDQYEIDPSMIASNISEAQVDAQITRKIHERAQSQMDMNMVNKSVPSAKVTAKMTQRKDDASGSKADTAALVVNTSKYGLLSNASDDEAQTPVGQPQTPTSDDEAKSERPKDAHQSQASTASVVMKSNTVREMDPDVGSDDEVDENAAFEALAKDATLDYGDDDDDKEEENCMCLCFVGLR